jgi:hypothetical protein
MIGHSPRSRSLADCLISSKRELTLLYRSRSKETLYTLPASMMEKTWKIITIWHGILFIVLTTKYIKVHYCILFIFSFERHTVFVYSTVYMLDLKMYIKSVTNYAALHGSTQQSTPLPTPHPPPPPAPTTNIRCKSCRIFSPPALFCRTMYNKPVRCLIKQLSLF